MAKMNEKKSSVLYILDILKHFTDKDHSLTYSQIINKLDKEYDISIERKTVARDIDILIDFGYDIVKRGNLGVYLGERMLEEGQLLYLIDAIYSSRSMPTSYARELVGKITADCSDYEKRKYRLLEKMDDGARSDSKQIFYTIEILSEAIEQGKKVSFQYGVYGLDKKLTAKKDGKVYIVNPYYMVNNHGKYYLVCNYDKYDNLGNYKIENIKDIKILDEDIKPLKSLPGLENFSIKEYMKEHIYMLAGESVDALIKIENEDRINDVISWFGSNIYLHKLEDEIFARMKVNEDALIYWALQYSDFVEVLEPLSTRNRIKEKIALLSKKYKDL